jgi:hypothetical protein
MRYAAHLLILSLCAGLSGASLAASVSSEATDSSETRSGRRMEQTEGMQLKKGETKRSAVGRDRRSTQSSGVENSANESVSLETGASALLIPIMQRVELGKLGLNTPLENEIRSCGFLTSRQAVPLGDFFAVNMLMKSHWQDDYLVQFDQMHRNYLSNHMGMLRDPISGQTFTLEQFNARPKKVLANGMVLDFEEDPIYQVLDGVQSYYKVRPAVSLVRCYFTYGIVLSDALQRLAQAEGSRVNADRNGNKTIIVRGDLEQMAVKAVASALSDSRLHGRILEYTRNTIQGGCSLPTVTGLKYGDTSWGCGALKVDPENATATLGGMPVLAENTYMGQRLQLAQSVSHSNNQAANESRSRYSSTDASNESGRELVVGRNRASTQEQNSSRSASSRSNTNATPK